MSIKKTTQTDSDYNNQMCVVRKKTFIDGITIKINTEKNCEKRFENN